MSNNLKSKEELTDLVVDMFNTLGFEVTPEPMKDRKFPKEAEWLGEDLLTIAAYAMRGDKEAMEHLKHGLWCAINNGY